MKSFIQNRPITTLLCVLIALIVAWMLVAVWPSWLIDIMGRKKTFVNTLLNGLTLAGLYFLVASGFSIIFGLMQNVNLAHGSLYLLGGYIGYEVSEYTGSWGASLIVAFVAVALVGCLLQVCIFRRMQSDALRQTLVTIGLSIIAADAMLAIWGGTTYQFTIPDIFSGAIELPIISVIKSSGKIVYIKYPLYRLSILFGAIGVGVLLWIFLNHTRLGLIVRAGVEDTHILSASGINIHIIFVAVFAIGAGLAGISGVIGGSALSIAPGEDIRYLLAALMVVIVGGMGSISGAALGALIIGLAEQFGLAYFPTYGAIITFVIMVGILAWKPQGIFGGQHG